MNIWLHRISHEGDIASPLLSKGYLSIGWSDFSSRQYLDKARGVDGRQYMDQRFHEEWGGVSRNRYSLRRFILEMSDGDRVLVPCGASFSIYKIQNKAIPISELTLPEGLKTLAGVPAIIKNGLLSTEQREKCYDLGFVIPIEPIACDIPRYEYADAALTARMKIRNTNANINDLLTSVDATIECFRQNRPLNLCADIIENTKSIILKMIKTITTPDKFEKLIKWYCLRVGASTVDIPAKNTNKDGDADIVAIFEPLKLILYIQAKFHNDSTGSWGVEQVRSYKDQFKDYDGYSRIAWVISTAEKFNDDAIGIALENGINLINGDQFAEMLINAGFAGLNI